MSWTAADYAGGVWTHATRTTQSGTAPDPDGTYLDSINHAVWEYATRALTGGSTQDCTARSITLGALVMAKPTAALLPFDCVARSITLGAMALGKPSAGGSTPVDIQCHGQVFSFTFPGDFVAFKGKLEALSISHVDPVNVLLLDNGSNEVFRIHTTVGKLTKNLKFPGGLIFDGLHAQVFSGGTLTVYLNP
jgi:hypothetical protein